MRTKNIETQSIHQPIKILYREKRKKFSHIFPAHFSNELYSKHYEYGKHRCACE